MTAPSPHNLKGKTVVPLLAGPHLALALRAVPTLPYLITGLSLYIVGPMSGVPRWNFPAFDRASEIVLEMGATPVSPAELGRLAGFDPDTPASEFTTEDYEAAVRRNTAAMLGCQGVVFLRGSANSPGARAEFELAEALGMKMFLCLEDDPECPLWETSAADIRAGLADPWMFASAA